MLGILRQITGARQKVWFQLVASYQLAGALPVVLILGLAGTIGYMVLLRGSANLVTRQLDLVPSKYSILLKIRWLSSSCFGT